MTESCDPSAERWQEAFDAHRSRFGQTFGAGEGVRLFFSPGRVNLMGAHLDYNGGPVMPTVVDRGSFIALRARSDRRLRMAATLDGGIVEFDLDQLPTSASGRWVDYPLGVLHKILELARDSGCLEQVAGFDVLFGGNLPVGAGLSSSASVCVGTALALDTLWELSLDPLQRVHAALHAEREFVGVRCGIMDPYAVGLARPGRLLWLDCKDRTYTHLPLDGSRFSIAVADTGVRRELAQGEFNRRVAECQEAFEFLRQHQPGAECMRDITFDTLLAHGQDLAPNLARRAEHVVRECSRTFSARKSLEAGDPAGLGAQMTRAQESLRELYEVSCVELDAIVDTAVTVDGVYGSRLTGAGFGGCAVILLETRAESALREALEDTYRRQFGRGIHVEVFEGDRGPREVQP